MIYERGGGDAHSLPPFLPPTARARPKLQNGQPACLPLTPSFLPRSKCEGRREDQLACRHWLGRVRVLCQNGEALWPFPPGSCNRIPRRHCAPRAVISVAARAPRYAATDFLRNLDHFVCGKESLSPNDVRLLLLLRRARKLHLCVDVAFGGAAATATNGKRIITWADPSKLPFLSESLAPLF